MIRKELLCMNIKGVFLLGLCTWNNGSIPNKTNSLRSSISETFNHVEGGKTVIYYFQFTPSFKSSQVLNPLKLEIGSLPKWNLQVTFKPFCDYDCLAFKVSSLRQKDNLTLLLHCKYNFKKKPFWTICLTWKSKNSNAENIFLLLLTFSWFLIFFLFFHLFMKECWFDFFLLIITFFCRLQSLLAIYLY